MENSIPQEAYAAAVLVLVYSLICLASSILLTCMLAANDQRTSYITLIAAFTSFSTLASMCQQLYYALEFRHVQEVQLQRAKDSLETPSLGYTPLSTGFNLFTYEVQYYSYCVNSMLICFWAVSLLKGMYNLRFHRLAGKEAYISAASKVLAVVLPAFLIGLSFIKPIIRNPFAFIGITNCLLLVSLVIGSVCVLGILFRYIASKVTLRSLQGSASHMSSGVNGTTAPTTKVKLDKVLLMRFTIGFVVISAYEIFDILFAFKAKQNSAHLAQQSEPDLSPRNAIGTILLFIPGVTGSLLTFVLFGTTRQFYEQYAQAARSWRCCNRPRRTRPSRARSGTDANGWTAMDARAPGHTYRYHENHNFGAGDAARSVELLAPKRAAPKTSSHVDVFEA